MRCPFCHSEDTQVLDTRASEEGDSIRRRRRCNACDKRFTTYERTLKLDEFSKRILQPAIKQLASEVAADCMSAGYKLVNRYTNATTNAVLTYRYFQQNGANLTNELAPYGDRSALLSPASRLARLASRCPAKASAAA